MESTANCHQQQSRCPEIAQSCMYRELHSIAGEKRAFLKPQLSRALFELALRGCCLLLLLFLSNVILGQGCLRFQLRCSRYCDKWTGKAGDGGRGEAHLDGEKLYHLAAALPRARLRQRPRPTVSPRHQILG